MGKPKKVIKKSPGNWIVFVFLLSFVLSMLMSWSSSVALASVGLSIAMLTVLLLVTFGIATDIIGVAVTAAELTPVIAMASRKVDGAKQALWMLQNADKVASVCNDVVGDICGIVSGAAGAALTIRISQLVGLSDTFFPGILVSALIAALTVGGKAYGKRIAMGNARSIIMSAGRVAAFFTPKHRIKK